MTQGFARIIPTYRESFLKLVGSPHPITALTLEDGATALTLEDGATALVLEDA